MAGYQPAAGPRHHLPAARLQDDVGVGEGDRGAGASDAPTSRRSPGRTPRPTIPSS